MSRAILLSMTEEQVRAQCDTLKVGVSAIERLVGGGVRLVCMSAKGAELVRKKMKTHLIAGHAVREPYRPATPMW